MDLWPPSASTLRAVVSPAIYTGMHLQTLTDPYTVFVEKSIEKFRFPVVSDVTTSNVPCG